MPMIKYRCADGHEFNKMYVEKPVESKIECKICGKEASRQLGSPKKHSIYTVSQGLGRDVEVSHTVIDNERNKIEKGYDTSDEKLREKY